LLVMFAFVFTETKAEIRLPALIGDNMVLQLSLIHISEPTRPY
jgi:hypothetical protein